MLVTSDIPAGQNLSDNANINISNLNSADVLVDTEPSGVLESGDELLFRFTRSVDSSSGHTDFQSDLTSQGLSATYSWNENYDRLTATLTDNAPSDKFNSDGDLEIKNITVDFASGSDEVLSFTFDVA